MRLITIVLLACVLNVSSGLARSQQEGLFRAGKGVEAALDDKTSPEPTRTAVNALATELLIAKSSADPAVVAAYEHALVALRDLVRLQKAADDFNKAEKAIDEDGLQASDTIYGQIEASRAHTNRLKAILATFEQSNRTAEEILSKYSQEVNEETRWKWQKAWRELGVTELSKISSSRLTRAAQLLETPTSR